jgi:GNAT superfamily N-acetyltransferase
MIVRGRAGAFSGLENDYRRGTAPAGSVELFREAVPEDADRLRRMFARCSRETIYLRFHASWPTVPEWAIGLLLAGAESGRDGRSIVAVAGTEIAGQAMYVRDPRDGREAEVAAVVEDRHQSGGVGRLLLSEIAAEARRAGFETLTCTTLGDNYRLLSIVSRLFPGSRTSYAGGECSIRVPLAV